MAALLRALAAIGQPGQVRRAYRTFAERVKQELGEEPSEDLQRLAQQLSRGACG